MPKPYTPPTVTDQPAPVRISTDCLGIVWYVAGDPNLKDGWHGCLKYDVAGETNFVGPFATPLGAQQALRAEFMASASATPRDTALVRGL